MRNWILETTQLVSGSSTPKTALTMQPTSSTGNGRPMFCNSSITADAAPPENSYCSPCHWHSSPVQTDMRETGMAVFTTITSESVGDAVAKMLTFFFSRHLIADG